MFEIRDDHYELLEVPSNASFQEIRNAYLRLKSMLNRDNLAGYALMSREEAEDLQRKTEDAYLTLSNPARRREYDRIRKEALIAAGIEVAEEAKSGEEGPRERTASSAHPFFDATPSTSSASRLDPEHNVPSTDFPGPTGEPPNAPPAASTAGTTRIAKESPRHEPPGSGLPHRNPAMQERKDFSAEIAERLARETDWSGPLIRWVREKRGLTIEELSELTKISRTYLIAIEEERFERLPAPVYLRGFMLQVARYLKLPQDLLVSAFLARSSEGRRADGQR